MSLKIFAEKNKPNLRRPFLSAQTFDSVQVYFVNHEKKVEDLLNTFHYSESLLHSDAVRVQELDNYQLSLDS